MGNVEKLKSLAIFDALGVAKWLHGEATLLND
jgi:hypothetical protein